MNTFNKVIYLIIVVLDEKGCLIFCYDYRQQIIENKPQVHETKKRAESRK